jgi:anaerobic magnesium-protoporphyrin IX monomethyl ester cyclase
MPLGRNQIVMKPHILLIHPLYGMETKQGIFQPGIELPISLAYLAAYLDREGFESEILDLRIETDPLGALRRHLTMKRPLAAGITASTAAIDTSAAIASMIKSEYPEIFTILGGWHASALPRETLISYPQFDYLIHGEGEIAFTKLLISLAGGNSGRDVPGVAWRQDGEVQVNPRGELIPNLDDLPLPARDKVPIDSYSPRPGTRNYRSLPSTGILVGRGCPYRCFFCYKGVWGPGVRLRSLQSVLHEIEYCLDRYGIRDFRFYDDAITQPGWDLEKFCEDLINRNLKINWNCWSRVNDVTESKLRIMKAAGCYHIKFGIEFGTEKALTLSRKGATLDQARQAVALAKKVGLECKGSFIFGIPGETVADCRETLRFALEISPHFATFYGFVPVPGSPFFEQIKKGKIVPARDMLPPTTTAQMVDEAYKKFYFRPTFIGQRLEQFIRHPQVETRMLWDGALMTVNHWLLRRG